MEGEREKEREREGGGEEKLEFRAASGIVPPVDDVLLFYQLGRSLLAAPFTSYIFPLDIKFR